MTCKAPVSRFHSPFLCGLYCKASHLGSRGMKFWHIVEECTSTNHGTAEIIPPSPFAAFSALAFEDSCSKSALTALYYLF